MVWEGLSFWTGIGGSMRARSTFSVCYTRLKDEQASALPANSSANKQLIPCHVSRGSKD
jgi:hypothetical protein